MFERREKLLKPMLYIRVPWDNNARNALLKFLHARLRGRLGRVPPLDKRRNGMHATLDDGGPHEMVFKFGGLDRTELLKRQHIPGQTPHPGYFS